MIRLGLLDYGQRVIVDAHLAEPVAAALETLFHGDARSSPRR